MARKRFRQVIEGWFEDQLPEEDEAATDDEIQEWLRDNGIICLVDESDTIPDGDTVAAQVTLSKFEILPLDPFHGVEESRRVIWDVRTGVPEVKRCTFCDGENGMHQTDCQGMAHGGLE